ncbi:MAG: hypothetical protein JXR44_04185 [Thiotrichales bacterium]|nr:hypothetical protein [Thiotrichales bacterium]
MKIKTRSWLSASLISTALFTGAAQAQYWPQPEQAYQGGLQSPQWVEQNAYTAQRSYPAHSVQGGYGAPAYARVQAVAVNTPYTQNGYAQTPYAASTPQTWPGYTTQSYSGVATTPQAYPTQPNSAYPAPSYGYGYGYAPTPQTYGYAPAPYGYGQQPMPNGYYGAMPNTWNNGPWNNGGAGYPLPPSNWNFANLNPFDRNNNGFGNGFPNFPNFNNFEMPSPPFNMPNMSMPNMSMPNMSMPNMGFPGSGFPGMGFPSMGMPSMGMPSMGW